MYLSNLEKIEDGRKLVCKFSEHLSNLILLLLDKMKNLTYNVFQTLYILILHSVVFVQNVKVYYSQKKTNMRDVRCIFNVF